MDLVALERASFLLLAALLFVLPIFEVPKTVAAWLFIVVSWWGTSSRNAGRRPDAFGWALLGVVTASLASTAINWPFPNKAKGLYDTAVSNKMPETALHRGGGWRGARVTLFAVKP